MKYAQLGISTSTVEVTNISAFGIWILTSEEELFLSYDDFPWFKDQPVSAIFAVTEPSPNHFYWPIIDVDLSLDSIRNPESFPLKAAL